MTPRARLVAWLALAIVVAVHLSVVMHRRGEHAGDFDLSRELGRRFLAGQPLYEQGLHYPYPPSAAMCFAPLALLPSEWAFGLRYATALACLALTLRLLTSMEPDAGPMAFSSQILTLVLGSHYVFRDLDDGGPHLVLLAILVVAVAAMRARRDPAAAIAFGLATAIKPTAAIFVPYLLWKRELRLAALTLGAVVAWAALPALWMGPQSWLAHERTWVEVSLASAIGNPIPGALESEARPQNQSLRRVAERIGTLLAGEPFGAAAALVLRAALVFFVAAWTRHPLAGRGDPRLPQESWGVFVASLLLSPVSWVQHFVLLLPGLHGAIVTVRSGRAGAPFRALLLLYVLLALGLNREVMGKPEYIALLSYGSHTLAALCVLALIVLRSRQRPATASA